jgi:hypothetical protein
MRLLLVVPLTNRDRLVLVMLYVNSGFTGCGAELGKRRQSNRTLPKRKLVPLEKPSFMTEMGGAGTIFSTGRCTELLVLLWTTTAAT